MRNVPTGYQTVMPYLIIDNAAGFIRFAQTVFKAELVNQQMRDETIVMHAELKIDDCTIMLADSTPAFAAMTGAFFIYVDNADVTYEEALTEGATPIMPVSNQSYGRSGGVTDPFGNTWWITSVL